MKEPGDHVSDFVSRLAIDPAVGLDDPHLREIVELLASDMEAVKARAPGLADIRQLDQVRRERAPRRLRTEAQGLRSKARSVVQRHTVLLGALSTRRLSDVAWFRAVQQLSWDVGIR